MVLIRCMERSGKSLGPLLGMLAAEFISASSNVIGRASLIQGTSSVVLNFYTFVSGAIFMAFLALIIDRNNRPQLNKWLCFRIFVMAFLGMTLPQNMIVAGLYFISSTIESAICNTLPIVTYIWAVALKQEKLDLNTWWGRGKLFGTLTNVSGALVIMFWNGSVVNLNLASATATTLGANSDLGYWFLGVAMMVVAIFCTSSWIIFLGPLSRSYPAETSLNALMMFFSMVQQLVIAVILNHHTQQWRLGWNLELLYILYTGIFLGLANVVMTWCCETKGPIFVASFIPFIIVFSAILETVFLQSPLHIGSVVGSIVVLVGLYIYLWSKYKEEQKQMLDGYESIEAPTVS
ncbi:hypothetical protein Sjap_009195 [Stephania japonica]|uniref:WAT1-related protein n=1 Tax=Stephania japonica TaxID=461633 RepID=A0AAP0JRN8_9MAGN